MVTEIYLEQQTRKEKLFQENVYPIWDFKGNKILSACEIYNVWNKNLNPEAAIGRKGVRACVCEGKGEGCIPFSGSLISLLEAIGFIYFTIFKDKIN